MYLSLIDDVFNDSQVAEGGTATASEPVGMVNLTESLDTLAIVASQDTLHASLLNLISRGAFFVCRFLKIPNPSATDLMFIAAIPQFGFEYTQSFWQKSSSASVKEVLAPLPSTQ